jgi:DNA invertase Pin-like site-specific DNA recombinase
MFVYETGKTMLIGYARVSKSDSSQVLDPQIDALIEHGVTPDHIWGLKSSGTETYVSIQNELTYFISV